MDKFKEHLRRKVSELQVMITANCQIEVIYHEQDTTIQSKFELSRKSVGNLSWVPPQIMDKETY